MPVPSGTRGWQSTTLTLVGLIRAPGKLYSIKDSTSSNETKMFMVCPKCKASKLDQLYCCQAGCVPEDTDEEAGKAGFKAGSCTDRGRMDGDKLIVMSEDEIAEAKGSKLEKGVLDLRRSPAAEVDARTWATGGAWWFEPERQDALYGLFVERVKDPAWAFIGTANIAGDRFVRLRPHNGGIVVEELLRPSDLRTFEMGSVAYGEKEAKMFDAILEQITEDFDPEAFESDKIAALRELIASKADDSIATVTPITAGKSAKVAEPDLADQLAIALAAAQAAKAAKAS